MASAAANLTLARLLYKSIENGDYSLCEQLLNLGANPNLLLPEGITPFHLAIGSDELETKQLVILLLSKGGNPNVRSTDGLTPVHVSAVWGKSDICQILLESGGDPSLTDTEGYSAFDFAIENKHDSIMKILIDHQKMKNPCLALSMLSLKDDMYLIQETKANKSIILPKTPMFSSPMCCQQLPTEEKCCENPCETSYRLRKSLSENFLNSFSISSWHLERFLSKSSLEELSDIDDTKKNSSYLIFQKPKKTRSEKNLNRSHSVNHDDVSQIEESIYVNDYDNSSAYITCRESCLPTILNQNLDAPLEFENVPEDNHIEDYFSIETAIKTENQQIATSSPNVQHDFDNFSSFYSTPCNEMIKEHKDKENEVDYLSFSPSICQDFKASPKLDKNIQQNVLSPCVEHELLPKRGQQKNTLSSKFLENSVKEYLYTDKEEGICFIEECHPSFLSSSSNTTVLDLSSNSPDDTIIFSWKQYNPLLNKTSGTGALNYDSSVRDIDKLTNTQLRLRLINHGLQIGPITDSTRKVYLKRLQEIEKKPLAKKRLLFTTEEEEIYSPPLIKALDGKMSFPALKLLEEKLRESFENPSRKHQWREGTSKNCFNYLLLDPRVTCNLPTRMSTLTDKEVFKIFIASIFYIGKGRRTRPYSHLCEAARYLKSPNKHVNAKIQHILDIWYSGKGIVSLHCFQNVIPVEAYTREACMVDAIGLNNLTNMKRGDFYGEASRWSNEKRSQFGTYLLYCCLNIFLHEGERQIRPYDV